jgi:hypothetical protein
MVVYQHQGKWYRGAILDVLHVPMMAESPSGILAAPNSKQPSMAVASYVWLPVPLEGALVGEWATSRAQLFPLAAVSFESSYMVLDK